MSDGERLARFPPVRVHTHRSGDRRASPASEYWVRWARSVIERRHLPAAVHAVANQTTAEQGTVAGARHNVPLLISPECWLPPVATDEPWTVGAIDSVALPAKIELRRPLRFERDGYALGRP